MDEPTLRRQTALTGLGLIMGGGESGRAAVPILDKLITSMYPDKKIGLTFEQIPTLMQTGSQYGMKTMDKSLKELTQKGLITMDTAMAKVKNREEFKQL